MLPRISPATRILITLSTLLFCIAHHEPLKAFTTSSAGVISDDVCVVGPAHELQPQLDNYARLLGPTGNTIVATKSLVLRQPDHSGAEHAITINGELLETTKPGTVLAGTPLGTDAYISAHIEQVAQKIKTRDIVVAAMPLQDQLILTRHCTQPMLTHILRGVPPRLTADAATEHH